MDGDSLQIQINNTSSDESECEGERIKHKKADNEVTQEVEKSASEKNKESTDSDAKTADAQTEQCSGIVESSVVDDNVIGQTSTFPEQVTYIAADQQSPTFYLYQNTAFENVYLSPETYNTTVYTQHMPMQNSPIQQIQGNTCYYSECQNQQIIYQTPPMEGSCVLTPPNITNYMQMPSTSYNEVQNKSEVDKNVILTGDPPLYGNVTEDSVPSVSHSNKKMRGVQYFEVQPSQGQHVLIATPPRTQRKGEINERQNITDSEGADTNSVPSPNTGVGILSAIVYPTVYVSPSGLITVLLKYDIAVEMTIDQSIRVVNHRHKSVVASNSRGNASCIYHSAVKLQQHNCKVEADMYWDRKVRISTDHMLLAFGSNCYAVSKEAPNALQPAHPNFSDMTSDKSVSILFSSPGYGPTHVPECESIVKNARYLFNKNGAISVIINNVKVFQDPKGEVEVLCGPKSIKASPVYGSMRAKTQFVDMSVEMNWNVKVKQSVLRLNASFVGLVASNGIDEAGFDQYRNPFVRPLHISPNYTSHYHNY